MNQLPWEDNLLERKTESDLKDLLKTLVAFANSVRPNHTAVILIGERDDGTVAGVADPDNIQKKVRNECERIYPDIVWRSAVYEKDSKICVRVEVDFSGETPHFAGPAWIRRGSETVRASDEAFQRLIEVRSSFVRQLAVWLGKEVTVYGEPASVPPMREKIFPFQGMHIFVHRWSSEETVVRVVDVNAYWVTLRRVDNGEVHSEPLRKLTLGFDDKRNQLKIIVDY